MKPVLAVFLAGFCAVTVVRGGDAPQKNPPASGSEEPAQGEQRLDEAWNKLPVPEKRNLLWMQQALRQMQPDEQKALHERIERFLKMTPEERERLRQNRKRWERMTPEERERAREEFRRRRHAFQEQWRHDHPNGEPPPPWPPKRRPGAAPSSAQPTPQQPKENE